MSNGHTPIERLNEARKKLDAAHDSAQRSQFGAQAGIRQLRDAQAMAKRGDLKLEKAEADLRRLEERRVAGRATVREARAQYLGALSAWLGDDGSKDFARLSAGFPILLFPTRIETRFFTDTRSSELRVRIYPDGILADSHEPELTAAEQAVGEKFWKDGWNPGTELSAWQALQGSVTPARAAWVVKATTPINLDERPGIPPVFAAVPLKEASWTRSTHARLLPDRWVVVCIRGERVVRAVTRPVVTPLALTLSPSVKETDVAELVDISGDGLLVDKDMLWTVDFAEAEKAGMAARVPLSPADASGGFDRVYVLGVRGSLAPEDAPTEVEGLVDCHHYGRGFAFVPQGTPTNNLTGAPSGFPRPDPDARESFRVERGAAQATPGTDSARLAEALGISPAAFAHVSGADRIEQQRAAAMNTLLWPVTWGYFFEQFMRNALDPTAVAATREYFVNLVRGRGPLPLMRVGNTPYGVLTVSGVDTWSAADGEGGVAGTLPALLKALLPKWQEAQSQVPRTGRSGDPDRDLLELLELDASAREVWIRDVFGPDFARNLGKVLNADFNGAEAARNQSQAEFAEMFGEEAGCTRLIHGLIERDGKRFGGGLVSDLPVSTEDALDFNYLAWLKPPTRIEDIRHERLPAGVTRPQSLLYRLVRQALLLLYRSAALDLKIKAKLAVADEKYERELVGVVEGSSERKTPWQHFGEVIPNVTGDASLGEYLPQAAAQLRAVEARRLVRNNALVRATPEVVPIKDYLAALEALENVPTDELELLTGETLDCCSHRLDAWITSLATQRLSRMRAERPKGLHLGAFGWVENLRPDGASRLRSASGALGVNEQVDSGGYINAPTLDHAAASAILRNAYLTRSEEGRAPYALDLSSERARLARWMLASVREGQPLTVLLGYRFERALHERQLDRFIEPLRRRFPLPATAAAVNTTPQESIAPRDVVHGIELQRAWKKQSIDLGTLTVPAPSASERNALTEELNRLDENADAVADLLTADSVYQLVRGAHSRAGASLDAVAGEMRPPEGDFAESLRSGTSFTHRIALVLGGNAPAAPAQWDAPASPRSKAEPALDGWLGAQLGNPDDIRARVILPAPTVAAPDATQAVPITLRALRLRPIDFLALLPASGAQPQSAVLPHSDQSASRGAELELRIAAAAAGANAQAGTIRLELGRDPAWGADVRSFLEVLEIARALKAVLSGARPLRAGDLVAPEYANEASSADLMTAEADQRAADALSDLDGSLTTLEQRIAAVPVVNAGDPEPDLTQLRAALRAAALFGLPEAYPSLPNNLHAVTLALLEARIAAARAATAPVDLEPLREALRRARDLGIAIEPATVAEPGSRADLTATLLVADRVATALTEKVAKEATAVRLAVLALAATVRASLTARRSAANAATTAANKLKAVFGAEFLWLPRFKPVRGTELDAALAQGPALGASAADKQRWLAQAAQVRAPLRRWRRLALYSGATRTGSGELDLVQLPHVDPARWVGLPFATEAERPLSGRVSIALFRPVKPAATEPWRGLVIDEWPEVIPARKETGGLTFHYDDPGAEAAQTLLLAVPPTAAENWSLDTLVSILDDTLMLAKIRGVHAEQLTGLGQILPAIYLAANPAGDTVSTKFTKDKVAATKFVFQET